MLTINFVFNILILCVAVFWVVLITVAFARIKQRQGHIAFLDFAYQAMGAVLWVLSVVLPSLHYGTLNTQNNGVLFLGGLAIIYIPNLIAWWRKRSAGAA